MNVIQNLTLLVPMQPIFDFVFMEEGSRTSGMFGWLRVYL